ncbi:MAG: nucleotide exchange factor GrpE, partial [Ignavibacteriales bacterium CG_4_9_14_3_um_filter_30_11]
MKKEKKKVKNKVKEEEKQQEILDKKEQENLSEQIEKLNSENTELKDKLLRKAAEFENYKRRTDNEQSNLLKYTGEHIFTNLLPVIDDFERSLKHINDSQDVEALKSGLKLVYEKLIKTLTEQGIKKIEAV